jgi:hypothetical protein
MFWSPFPFTLHLRDDSNVPPTQDPMSLYNFVTTVGSVWTHPSAPLSNSACLRTPEAGHLAGHVHTGTRSRNSGRKPETQRRIKWPGRDAGKLVSGCHTIIISHHFYCTCFKDLLPHTCISSAPCTKWHKDRFHLRNSCVCHVVIIRYRKVKIITFE